jgi:hypothetical protein
MVRPVSKGLVREGDKLAAVCRIDSVPGTNTTGTVRGCMVYDSFTLAVYAEVVNATLTRTVLELEQDPMTRQVSEYSYRIFLSSIGVRGEL